MKAGVAQLLITERVLLEVVGSNLYRRGSYAPIKKGSKPHPF